MIRGDFDLRLECDYKDLIAASVYEAANEVKQARAFIDAIKTLVDGWWASVEFWSIENPKKYEGMREECSPHTRG